MLIIRHYNFLNMKEEVNQSILVVWTPRLHPKLPRLLGNTHNPLVKVQRVRSKAVDQCCFTCFCFTTLLARNVKVNKKTIFNTTPNSNKGFGGGNTIQKFSVYKTG